MLQYLKRYWVFCLLAPLFMVGEVAVDLIQPALMAKIVDEGVLGANLQIVLSVGIQMILLVLAGGLSGIICGVFANLAAQNFGNDLRKDLFSHIMNLSFEQTEYFSTGSLVTRITNDVTQVQNMVMMTMRGVVRNGIMFFGGIYMLYRQSPKFAMVTACGLPFVVLLVFFFLKKGGPLFTIVQKKLDGVNNVMQENVAGARVVKAFVKEDYELNRFDDVNNQLYSVNLRAQSLLAFISPAMNIVLNLCVVSIIYVGGLSVRSSGSVTTGEIMAAITYVAQILHGILFMANISQTFIRARASVDRINEVLRFDPCLSDGAMIPDNRSGSVEFRDVQFAYPNSSGKPVLDKINLKVEAGETVAILGATGSGKSSLVKLIPRFYDTTAGEILFDGVNVKDYSVAELRRRIAIVLQKAELYSRSLTENIQFGKPDASQIEIRTAAEVAQAHDFISDMPDGYDSIVTEGGHSLSGGQKQRISISRAVLKDAEILILDDSTSALDLKTEASLYNALRKSKPRLTKLIIAQRIASVRNADHIAVLENGRIAAFGTHNELLRTSPIYQDIYHSQVREEGEPT